MIPPYVDDATRTKRLRTLIALEVSRIVEDLDVRKEFLIAMWSSHRDRAPFLETVYSRWNTLSFTDLACLELEEVVVIDTFFRELEEFRLYIRFTQDMPTMMSSRYDWMLRRLEGYGRLALEALGGAPERPLVEFEDEDPEVPLLRYAIPDPDEVPKRPEDVLREAQERGIMGPEATAVAFPEATDDSQDA
jgi:hypothetical protein